MSPARYAPLYQWLSDTLRDDITRGVYKLGEALPTEHELMRRYSLSITTVRRAVHDLAREGWIYRKAGKGTFVKRSRLEEHLLRLTSFAEELKSRGIEPSFHLVEARVVPAPAGVARALHLKPREKTWYIERVQLANGEPIALARGYWRYDIGACLATFDLNHAALYDVVENTMHIRMVEGTESISASIADADIARALGVERSAPLLVRCRVSYTSDMQALEHTTSYYRADRYEYKIRLTRH